jgi:hypothetical protein
MSLVRVSQYAACPFSAAVELAEKILVHRQGMHVSPSAPFGERVHFRAATTDDYTDEARKHEALLIAWRPRSPLFPEFRGVVTVRPEHRGVLLHLQGDYAAPFGAAGKIFDFVIGRAIARRTMQNFLRELAAEIEAAYFEERKAAETG